MDLARTNVKRHTRERAHAGKRLLDIADLEQRSRGSVGRSGGLLLRAHAASVTAHTPVTVKRSAIERKPCAARRLRRISTRCRSRITLPFPRYWSLRLSVPRASRAVNRARSKLLTDSVQSRRNVDALRAFAYGELKSHRIERNGPWAAIKFVLTLRCPISGTTSTRLPSTIRVSFSTGRTCLAPTCASRISAAATRPRS